MMEHTVNAMKRIQSTDKVGKCDKQVAFCMIVEEQVHKTTVAKKSSEWLLDMDVEEGEVFSNVDKSILDKPPGEGNETCSKCKMPCIEKYAYICVINKKHRYCPKCTHDLM